MISILAAVPMDIAATSGPSQPTARVSHALSAPDAITGSPSGSPVISATSFDMYPITSHGFLRSCTSISGLMLPKMK